jgi:plastocyanin
MAAATARAAIATDLQMRTVRFTIDTCPHTAQAKVPMIRSTLLAASAVMALFFAGQIQAAEPELLLVIKNHRFEPAELKVPAGQRVKLIVHNQDATPEEFESHSLGREKLIPAGARVSVFIGPLKPGSYSFVGEFNEATAKGTVVAE